jgi:hypothetical protein
VSHAGIWTGTICLALVLLGIPFSPLDVAFLFVVHCIADYMKAKPIGFYKRLNPLGWGLFIDQMIHLIQIAVVLYL